MTTAAQVEVEGGDYTGGWTAWREVVGGTPEDYVREWGGQLVTRRALAAAPDPGPRGDLPPPDEPPDEEYLAAVLADDPTAGRPFPLRVTEELLRLRAREEAQRILRQEQAGAEPDFVRLDRFLAIDDEPEQYRVDGLWPVGGRIICAAQWKAGKTTARDNLVRSLADGERFLGRFTVHRPAGQVVIIDNELDERMLRRWLRDQGIRNEQSVSVLALRGQTATFNPLDPDNRARWAAKLRHLNAAVVLFDCLRPVLDALGLSEDKDAGRFLTAFDALLHEAAVGEAVVIHHMGHTGERSRGDSVLRGWPDVEWQLLREKTDDGDQEPNARRFFRAYGRDVDVPEGLLTYDHDTRRLTLAGGTRKDAKADAGVPEILAYLDANPGATQRGVEAALKDALGGPKAARAALKRAIATDLVDVADGPNRSHLHFLTTPGAPGAPAVRPEHPAHPGGECASAPIGAHGAPPPPPEAEQLDLDRAHSAPEGNPVPAEQAEDEPDPWTQDGTS